MRTVTTAEAITCAIDALHHERLAILCGAGLSMGWPSCLPSAANLAADAKAKYDAMYGASRPPLPAGIEDQAEYFFNRGELGTIYLRTFIDKDAFAGRPNPGHDAIADLLLVRGIQTAISTNVDTMIETAGQMLFGQIGVGYDQASVAQCQPDVSPLLKVHGCWTQDQANTVWAPSQLNAEPVMSRVTSSANWMNVRLQDRDLIIVGFFTDWDYINNVLAQTLGNVRPARVIVVDPSAGPALQAKAPALYDLLDGITDEFLHVAVSGADFLEALRLEFSRSFVRRVIHAGAQAFEDATGNPPDPTWLEPPAADNETYWRMRRDLEGRRPNQPSSRRAPNDEPAVGLTLLQMRARGATNDGDHWLINGIRVRVLRAANQLLHQVEAAHARGRPPVVAPDLTIAVGAEATSLPANILRSSPSGSIVRGGANRWLTRGEAVQELGL